MHAEFFATSKVVFLPPDSTAATTFSLAAGTTDVNSGVLDLNAHGLARDVSFIIGIGAVVSGGSGTIKVQGSNDNSNWVDIAGTSQAWADDSDFKKLAVEVVRPIWRYLRVVFDRTAQNSTIEFVQAILTGLRTLPPTQLLTDGQFVRTPELFNGPAAGTA